MKYLLLVNHNEDAFSQMSETVRRGMLAESVGLTHALNAAGQYVDASPLHPTAEAARVSVRNGKRLVTGGPFVETHEQIAGYFMVSADSLEAAIDIAAKIPGARIGSMEVRQVRDIEGLPPVGSGAKS
jgi:hypothetical protein